MASLMAVSLSDGLEEPASQHEQDSACTPAVQNKDGAPKSMIWEHFNECEGLNNRNRRKGAACKYCGKKYKDGRVEALEKHTSVECREVPPPVRAALHETLVEKYGVAAAAQSTVTQTRKRKVEQSVLTAHYESGQVDRFAHLLGTLELSAERHTSTYLTEIFRECINQVGANKVAALVTDNAASMKLARRLLTNEEEYKHIIDLRPLQLLKDAAKADGVNTTLHSFNKTRFTSVHRQYRDDIKNKAIITIIDNQDFWDGLSALCQLLEPFSKVISAVQADNATLADITRYWLYLAKAIKDVKLPADMRHHVVHSFNTR
eukprot:jgi/Chlat1/2680/Chrsp18S02986